MAAHQVPQVTQGHINFHSNSYMPVKHTLNQTEMKSVLELFQSDMHNMCWGIRVFINSCVHMCILVCMCVTQRDAWLPIDVIIFHFQALFSAWVPRYFYYSVCVILCVSVCVCAYVHVAVCMCAHTWMGVWYRQEGEACVSVHSCVGGCFKKWFSKSSRHFPVLSGLPKSVENLISYWNSCDKEAMVHQVSQCRGNRFESLVQMQSFILLNSNLLN